MLGRIAAALLAATLLVSPVTARKPDGAKAAIARSLTRLLNGDYSSHSQAQIYAAIKPTDINRDAVQDWQVDFNAFGSAWCGTGGCRYQLWLGQKSGNPRMVFNRQVREVTSERRSDRIVFVFDFHGSECGGFGAEACPGEFTWDAKRRRMILLPTPKKHTALANPMRF